ncbi:class E sortase [Actinomyces vulturis]|uniref:class E sortase n=1 Tax=Actinomyces vulturis TaxID=1857645 RepID=UPI0008345590|nr:class E sortase [Actinomyces vulturis]
MTSPSRSRTSRVLNHILLGIGELLITAGVIVALFLVWQLWWTGIDATEKAQEVSQTFYQELPESPKKTAEHHTDPPPVGPQVGYGETIGMLIVPDWYGITENQMPIIEGTGRDVLDQAAAGHYEYTQQIGEVGNFAIAGHRRTNGNSFRRIDLLEPGDEIVVETADTWYVYTVTDHEIVEPNDVDVIAPVPNEPGADPTERYLTLTTCHSTSIGEWGNDHRWITHAKFSYWIPRSEGRPESVLSDPEVN